MKGKIKYIVVIAFAIIANPCFCQNTRSAITNQNSFHEKFNAQFNGSDLLLACIMYSKTGNAKTAINNKYIFIDIAGSFQSCIGSTTNYDSVADEFIEQHKKLDFTSVSIERSLHQFIENYEIVNDLIFSKITSDDDVEQMKIFKKKILKLPELAVIYRSYITEGRDMGSLSSAEGIALNIQIAYYLYIQNSTVRNRIIKQLL
jgi:hypothetical protein